MRLLLDTHAFLWWVEGTPKLGKRAVRHIAEESNEVFVSIASCWEMAIKVSLVKLRLGTPIETFVTAQLGLNGFSLLSLELRHVARVAELPFHHRDPFDRILVAQALEDQLLVVSSEAIFSRYGVRRLW